MVAWALLCLPAAVRGEEKKDDKAAEPVVTRHVVSIGGQPVHFTATAGFLPIKEDGKKERARMFFVAYTRTEPPAAGAGADAPAVFPAPEDRPITFSFNGGPGSSSVWLHLGVLGPFRVEWADDAGSKPAPPYRLVENAQSIVDVSDVVFIDPVTTGFSRASEGTEPRAFHGVQEDVESVAEFIRLYLTRNNRWTSPKFVIGESYGTTRAANLANYLQDRLGINLNGVMLVSTVLNFQTIRFDRGNDWPFVLFLPTYSATAWHHGRLPQDLQARPLREVLDEVERFAIERYLPALAKGSTLGAEDERAVVSALARYTGLGEEYIRRTNMRIEIGRFTKELLRDQRRTVGRFDSRFTGIDYDAAGERFDYDPSYANIQGPFTAGLNDLVRRKLKFESDMPYEILTGRVQPWSYEPASNRYLNVAEPLRSAITDNPRLKVLFLSGYYDLATPHFAADYTINQLGLDPSLRANVSHTYYPAGHMMYIHRPSLERMKRDLEAFYRSAAPSR
ncbi:MAG: peptidase S10 [Phycisphaerales bacterium]|nr:peptidase S10 [Phycisphaerales bacterium]